MIKTKRSGRPAMLSTRGNRVGNFRGPLMGFAAFALIALTVWVPWRAQAADQTDLNVVVKDAETGEPINQAHLTLQFRERRRLRKDSFHSFSAKTDRNGRCRFRFIPVGPVQLIVTAEKHQSFGKEFEIEKNNPVVEVKLRGPQPQI